MKKTMMKPAIVLAAIILGAAVAQAGLFYVDATDDVGGNTTLADGSPLVADDTTGATTWRQRNDATFGESGTVFEGVDDEPMLKTTITGLTVGQEYTVRVFFSEKDTSTSEKWNIKAGFTTDSLIQFGNPADAIPGATAAVKHDTLTFDNAPSFGSAFPAYAGEIGNATADVNGEIAVYIDSYGSGGLNYRTWYDGVGYEAPVPPEVDQPFTLLTMDGGWCWYSDPRALFHNGKLYFSYVRPTTGKTVLDAFDLSTGENTNLWYSEFAQVDDHNVPGLCVKDDGTMLAVYARHLADYYFAYRTSTSTNPVSPADWNAEQRIPNSGYKMTYANPFQLSGESGKIYNFCRNYNFNPTVYTSTDGGSSWSSPQQFIAAGSSSTVRPYVKYCSDGVDRVDFLYTDGHPRDVANSLYHMYYQGGSFYKTDGTFVKAYANLPINHDTGERGSVIYQYSDAAEADPNEWIPAGRAWCWETAYQTNGDPVCVFTVQKDLVAGSTSGTDDRIYYYYARWTGTAWQKRFIAHAGRPLYSAEDDYAGGICVDPLDPDVIYISSNMEDPFNLSLANTALRANSRYEIWKGVTSDGGLSFDWTPVTTNSASDNLRPYIPRRNGGEECVIWFRGTYNTYSSFSSDIVGIFTSDVPVPTPPPPAPPINYVDASSGSSGNTTVWNGSSWATFNPPLNIVSTADNQWEEETGAGLGNGPTQNWFESNREGTENCPQLRTTVTGLPDSKYDVYAYFWVANGQGFVFGAALTNNPSGSLPLYSVGSTGVVSADSDAFANTVMVVSADRTLYQVSLGSVTGSSVTAYIDDEANGGYSSSCWYDGIGYRQHLATKPTDLSVGVTNGLVTVSWPDTHKGWLLQSAINLTNDWSDVSGSTTNTSLSFPGGSIESSEFFRLRYPIQ